MDKKLDAVKLDAILACRVGGTRLYGKPLQFLDIKNRVTILEYLVRYIKQVKHVDSICLAIAEGKQNYGFAELAERHGWNYVFGSEEDMLGRIIKAAKKYDTDKAHNHQLNTRLFFLIYLHLRYFIADAILEYIHFPNLTRPVLGL